MSVFSGGPLTKIERAWDRAVEKFNPASDPVDHIVQLFQREFDYGGFTITLENRPNNGHYVLYRDAMTTKGFMVPTQTTLDVMEASLEP